MQCPLCNRTYNSGKFCTSCESPDGGAVRLVEGTRQVDPNDLDEYIKMLDVFLSDGFLSADEKSTLQDLRRQFGISEQQHQSILTENGYKYRETMPVRMVLNRKTIQGYGAGQPCLAKVRLVNTERRPLQRVEIRYWLNSEEVHTSTLRQLMSNKVREIDLDFIPQKSGQYALKMELTVDPFIGDKTEYVVESTSFQVYSQAQLQSVHIHQSGENIVGNHKVHGTDMPKAMLLGDGQWDELVLSPKQQAVEWGEWSAQRLFEKVNPIIEQATQKYGSEPEWQRFLLEYPVKRIPNEDFIVWEARLKGLEAKKNEVIAEIEHRIANANQLKPLDVVSFGNGNGRHEMVVIPKGEFMMGALEDDGDVYDGEKPRHKVTLTRDFLMGKYPVTQALWENVMGSNPSHFKGANRPVEKVSWFDVVAFCNKLSQREGLEPVYTINGKNVTCNWKAKGYRLPTEAEWEYSARANQSFQYSGSNNVDEVAWYGDALFGYGEPGNSGDETHPVGQKTPNGFGLYDMSGNVDEWCWDVKGDYTSGSQTDPTGPDSGPLRVKRGGSWSSDAWSKRVSYRNIDIPTARSKDSGFRLVRLTP